MLVLAMQALDTVPDSDTCPKEPKQLSDMESGTISSTSDYRPHSACYWEINNQVRPFITLKPDSFDIEQGYDYVYVSDMGGVIGFYSGKELANNTVSTDSGTGCAMC
jgi:hypothetical protein